MHLIVPVIVVPTAIIVDARSWSYFDWLVKETKHIGLRFSSIPWKSPLPHFPPSTIYAELEFRGRKLFGLGHDPQRPMGYIIAASEVFERVAMIASGLLNSNGCAVHLDVHRSRENALLELIERDAFLCHYYTRHPGHELGSECSERMKQVQDFAKEHGFQLKARSLSGVEKKIVLVLAQLPSGGVFTGLGISDSESKSLEKALGECWRFVDSHLRDQNSFTPSTLAEFINKKNKVVSDHVNWSVHPENGSFVWQGFNGDAPPIHQTGFDQNLVEYKELKLGEIFEGCPLYFSKASHPSLAEVEFGDRWHRSIHLDRFRRFYQEGQCHEFPHPMG